MVRHVFPLLTALLATLSAAPAAPDKPNILLILADDVGFSDLGCYGGEIATPNLDTLAAGGMRLSDFYNTSRCTPTRASILTGLHPLQAGIRNMTGDLATNAVTIPEVLKPAGYRTLMVGKWHLGEKKNLPTDRGFDEFYGMLGGFNTCWAEKGIYTRWPQDRAKRIYAPEQFYATDVFADYAVDFIGDGKTGQPWFLYLAFNAPHFPLHAPESDIAKYEAMYFEKGWDAIREERLARQKKMGIMPESVALSPREVMPRNPYNVKTGWADKEVPAWDSLPEDRRRDLARRMAVYAAMVDTMDQAIGRVLAHLKSTGQENNTVVFFLSDNGACAEWDPFGFDGGPGPNNILHTGDDLKKVGAKGSYVSPGTGWATVGSTPFRLYKHYAHEGGVRTPFIVHWPAGLKAKGMVPGIGYITDFMPTIRELAGATYPKQVGETAIQPEEGVSLMPIFNGTPLAPRKIFMEHEGNRFVREGDWKLVGLNTKGKVWELYNLAADPNEMNDLAAQEPARVKALSAAFQEWLTRCRANMKPTQDTNQRDGKDKKEAANSDFAPVK